MSSLMNDALLKENPIREGVANKACSWPTKRS